MTIPFFPVVELVDRYAIAKLKYVKIGQTVTNELDFYQAQLLKYDLSSVDLEIQQLYDLHSKIWSLESELKSGVEHQLTLEEIGRRAIEIRDWNNKRIALKNTMAEKLNCSVREIKKDHLSQ